MNRRVFVALTTLSILSGCDVAALLSGKFADIEPRFQKVDLATGDRSGQLATPEGLRAADSHIVVGGGKIYWLGGLDEGLNETDFFDVFDPATGNWTSLPKWPHPREAPLQYINGRICAGHGSYLESGSTEIVYERRVECYDIAAQTWTELPGMPGDTLMTKLVGVDDKIYVAGGDFSDSTTRADAHVFDFATNTWTDLPDLPTKCSTSQSIALGDILYVIGCNGDTAKAVYGYDMTLGASGDWATLASLPAEIEHYQDEIVVLDGKIVVGFDEVGVAQQYDPSTDMWSALPAFPEDRSPPVHFYSTVIADKLYVFPALLDKNDEQAYFNEVWTYAPGDAAWTNFSSDKDEVGLFLYPAALDGDLYLVGSATRLTGT